ncbi:MAG TPA: GlsB/YeaQ/YmgE family stress response membrane protein [Candidatus Limnocylindria bacterium]|jgi:uncharacterized membrane protein YeaQ/YmgE (transglycosylase-associated protein family)
MPDLGIFGWILVGLVAGAIAGAFVPGDKRQGCLGTLLVGIVGGLIGGWVWTELLDQPPAGGLLGATVVAVLGSILILAILRAVRRT